MSAQAIAPVEEELQRAVAELTGPRYRRGLEETPTLHRLGLAEKLRLSFSTTNVIESIQAHVGRLTDGVDRYRTSEQKQRWVGTALLEIEPRLRWVRGMKHLPAQRAAPQREIGIVKRQSGESERSNNRLSRFVFFL